MKAHERFTCPVCGEESFLKEQVKMDGFTVTGKILVCALCGAEAGNPSADEPAQSDNAGRQALAALLGESPEKAPGWALGDEDHFCRDCVHFIEHPFKTLCGLTNKAVEAMSDCSRFERRELSPGKKQR